MENKNLSEAQKLGGHTTMENNNKVLYEIKEEEAKLHLSQGNNKIGKTIWSFATLPGNEEHIPTVKVKDSSGKPTNESIRLTSIPGTCSKYCDNCARDGACYAWRDLKLHNNVCAQAWAENTLLLRSGKVFDMLSEFINDKNAKFLETKDEKQLKVKTVRINTSGEIENLEQFEAWNKLALSHPEVTFGVYTKNFDDLDKFIQKHGDTAPNFVVNVSQWKHVADEFLAKYPKKFNVFEYDDSNKKDNDLSEEDKIRLAATVHCPAVNAQGHHVLDKDGKPITCDRCGRCYRKTGKVTAVHSH